MFGKRPANKKRKNQLPNYWQRIARPEEERDWQRAHSDSTKLRNLNLMENDRYRKWNIFHSQVKDVEEGIGFKIREEISRRIGKFSERNPFKIFDIGCGSGVALAQLKKQFGKNIKTVGLVFAKTPKEKYGRIDRLLIGDINKIIPRERYDRIYSYQGAIVHTEMKTTAVQRAIEWLKPDGTAALDIGELHAQDPVLNEIKTALRQNGIKDYKLEKSPSYHFSRTKTPGQVLIFKKPAIKLP